MKKILVSKCLYGGDPVRYDGKSKEETDPRFLKWKEEGRLIPFCPEVFGGLKVPRCDAQRRGNSVIARTGEDVTGEYLRGAVEAMHLAKQNHVVCAIMKEKSPSCGSSLIYDGTFEGNLVEGQGTATELLREAGIRVYSEEQLNEVEALLAQKNIVLIGMPASGKSVTGVVLAKTLHMNFLDADLLIEEKAGMRLQDIINEKGIDEFKRMEEDVLLSIHETNTVIATGGSAIYYDEAMRHLKSDGVVVYIRASLDTIKNRLNNIRTRGVAMGKGQTLDDLYAVRTPLYERYADITVDTGDTSMEHTVEAMTEQLADGWL